MTVGLYASGSTVTDCSTGKDSAGKMLFPSQSLMMREKVDIYKQYAANLLGDADSAFFAPFGSTTTSTTDRHANHRIDDALFLSFKRLFSRDQIKRETLAFRMYRSGVLNGRDPSASIIENGYTGSNIALTSPSGSAIFSDIGASSNIRRTFGGEVGNIVNASNTSETVGLIFYDQGTAVIDMGRALWSDQAMSGTIEAMAVALSLIHI